MMHPRATKTSAIAFVCGLAIYGGLVNAHLRRPQSSLSLSASHVASVRGTHIAAGGGALLHKNERTARATIRKPVTDSREYLSTTFSSGLRVLAVQDASAKRVGFAVAVEAGSLEDPPEFQGLAHFCEHMLFLGSKKYPDTDEFSRHLALFGGTHNAYTSAEETVYFNEIGAEGIETGLDIFAQFFISPSFAEKMVDKEIHAVDSEHKKNQPDVQRRLWHLLRSRANPKSPVHQFSTGDLGTLKTEPESHGLSLKKALKAFHSKHYCANRLHLVLVGNMSTTDQLDLAHRHFDALPEATSDCTPRPVYTDIPLYSKELGNLGRRFSVSTHGAPELWLMLPVPPLKQHYKEQAEAYLWNALGNYGAGSLKALLLQEDLSQHYSFHAENTVAGSVVFITFSLTEKGAQDPNKILEYFFAYVNVVRGSGVNAQLLDSVKQLRQVSFDYQEKKASEFDFVSSLAGSLPSYGPEDVLTGGSLMDRPNAELVRQVLESITPSNMNIALVSPQLNESMGRLHEKYYDFNYDEEPIEPALIQRLQNASGFGLVPPPDLTYVPRRLDLISEVSAADGPEELVKGKRTEGWWLGPGNIKLPKAVVYLKLAYPETLERTAQFVVLAAMHARIVQLVLEQPTDMLQTCGLGYSVAAHADGMSISFGGFDEHLSQLAALVLPRVRQPGQAGAAAFEQARRQLVLDLSDVTKLQPYQHAMEAFEVVSMKGRFSRAEMLRTAQDVALVDVASYQRFLEAAFADIRLSMLVAGNMDRQRSRQFINESEQALGLSCLGTPFSPNRGSPQVLDPVGPLEVRIPNPIHGDPNSATLIAYQFGVPSLADRVHLSMLGEVIDRPVFEALRTERQLGYVVFGYVAPHTSIVEVRVLVQGFRESPDTVEALVEETVQNLTRRIAALAPEEIAKRRQSLRTQLQQPPATLTQFAGQYWDQIWKGTHCFRKKELQLAHLDAEEAKGNATKTLLDAWLRAVAPPQGKPKKIAVKLFGAGAAGRPGASVGPDTGAGAGPITLVDAASLKERLKDQQYWPQTFICS